MEPNNTQIHHNNQAALCEIAQDLQNYNYKDDHTDIAEKIRHLTSITIWAEKNSKEVFDEFFDSKILQKMFNIFLRSKKRELLIVIIESISLMMANFQKQEGITRLLYDPAMLNFLIIKFNMMTTEIAEYYINLLKSLTTRIDENVLPLIYSEKQPSFALAWQASRFYNHPELLIRAAGRTIILSLMKIDKPVVKQYFSSFPFVIYYSHLSLFIKEYWFKINQVMQDKWDSSKEDLMRLPEIVENHFDILLYVEDLMDNGSHNINKCVVNALLTYLISDTIYCLKSSKKEQFSTSFCLYILGVIFKALKNPLLIEILTIVIFGHYSLVKVTSRIQESRFSYLDSFNKRWSFKNMWDPFDDQLNVYHKYTFTKKHHPSKSPNKKGGVSNLGIVSQTLYLFGIVTNPKFNSQVQKMAKIYGFDMLVENRIIKYDSIAQIYECLRDTKLFQAMIDPDEFDENPLKQLLFQFLMSKDDNLIMLTLQLLLSMLNNPAVSKQTLSFCRINIHQRTRQFYTRVTSQKLLERCFQILTIYPTVRLCTIYNTIKLVLILTNCYQNKNDVLNQEMKDLLYKALKISIDVMNIKIDNYKNQYTLVSLYKEVMENANIHKKREFGIAAYGLVGQNEITSLYQKIIFTDKEELEKNMHFYFLLKQFAQQLFPTNIQSTFPKLEFENPNTKYQIQGQTFITEVGTLCRLVDNEIALECLILFQPSHLIVLHPFQSSSPPKGKLLFSCIYRRLDFRIQDSKRLSIHIVNSSCVIQKSIILLFQGSKKCTEMKEELQKRRNEMTKEAQEAIRRDIGLCLQKMSFLKDKTREETKLSV